jgi:transcription elongation factor Elf1
VKKSDVESLWVDFLENIKSTATYIDYYISIVSWVKQNKKNLGKELIDTSRLGILLSLDPKLYISTNPEISLGLELNRLGRIQPRKLETIIMVIENTIWDLVTIRSRIDCPNCSDDELRYVLIKKEGNRDYELLLECETCGWIENLNRKKWNGKIIKVFPANKDHLLENGIEV